jgi:hypothetical protein
VETVMTLDFAALNFASWEEPSAPSARPAAPTRVHALWQGLFDSYRPEQHYMRGPGPKALAKVAYATVQDHASE